MPRHLFVLRASGLIVVLVFALMGADALARGATNNKKKSSPPPAAPSSAKKHPAEVHLKEEPTEASSAASSASASAPPPSRGPTRIDFDDRLIQGQTNKSGAVYLYERKELKTRSMVKKRESFRDEIVGSVYDG